MALESPAPDGGIYRLPDVDSMEGLNRAHDLLEQSGFEVVDGGHDLSTDQWQVEVRPPLQPAVSERLSREVGLRTLNLAIN
jgi:hypothetical protein